MVIAVLAVAIMVSAMGYETGSVANQDEVLSLSDDVSKSFWETFGDEQELAQEEAGSDTADGRIIGEGTHVQIRGGGGGGTLTAAQLQQISTCEAACGECPKGLSCDACVDDARTCSICMAGQHSGAGVVTCTDCVAGKASSTGTGQCSSCPQGKFAEQAAVECSLCDGAPAGATECLPSYASSYASSYVSSYASSAYARRTQ